MSAQFNWLPVASALHNERAVAAAAAEFEPGLVGAGGSRAGPRAVDDPTPVVLLVLTGGTEQQLLMLAQRRQEIAPGEPIHLVAHPGQNSLPAALEVLAALHQQGVRGRIVYLRGPADRSGLAELGAAAQDLQVRRFLQTARIGLIGDPSDWLVASSPSADAVRRTWGPKVVKIGINDLIYACRHQPVGAGAALARSVTAGTTATLEPDAAAVDHAAAVFPALQALVEHERLTAVTVRCFDLIKALGTSGCLALAELNDLGVVAGCEGDLVSTVGMLWLDRLLGGPLWMANPSQLDKAAGILRLAHCTVPRRMVTSYRLRSHFESGLGVGIQGRMAGGDVTLVRIGGEDLDRLWTVEGTAVPAPLREDLCRTQLEIQVGSQAVEELLRAPLGNHLLVHSGHHRERLQSWWQTMIKPLNPS